MPQTVGGWVKVAMNVIVAAAIGYSQGDISGAIVAASAVLAGLFQKQPSK